MNEHPILFSGEIVRAILDGRKTQTRRVIKPQPISADECRRLTGTDYSLFTDQHSPNEWRIGGPVGVVCLENGLRNGYHWKCPYGETDDRLWVKESFFAYGLWVRQGTRSVFEDRTVQTGHNYLYAATDPEPTLVDQRGNIGWHKRPSIFMSRTASRITLEITNIRVERLHDISENDAKAEGVQDEIVVSFHNELHDFSYRKGFKALWEKINGKKYPWDSNPYVWVIEFTKI